jgi:hypothetical protein
MITFETIAYVCFSCDVREFLFENIHLSPQSDQNVENNIFTIKNDFVIDCKIVNHFFKFINVIFVQTIN